MPPPLLAPSPRRCLVGAAAALLLPLLLARAASADAAAAEADDGVKPPDAPGEVWSAFFAFNNSNACAAPVPDAIASFYVSRFSPSSGAFAVSQPYNWPTLGPLHSKTLNYGGTAMATDAGGRRGWAVFQATTWTQQVFVVQLSFPRSSPKSSIVVGVCALTLPSNTSTAYDIGRIYYHASVSAVGPWYLDVVSSSGGGPNFGVTTVTVPPLPPKKKGSVPSCVTRVVANISTATGFYPNTLPAPVVGTDKRGSPLYVSLGLPASGNASEIVVNAWSVATGARVYNATYACGFPSYLYSCPPLNSQAPLSGLNGLFLTNGTLLLGGGPWSSQAYFQGALPVVAEPEEGEGEMGAAERLGSPPALTFVNISSAQGTWFYGAQLLTRPSAWPVTVQLAPGTAGYGGGTCVSAPGYSNGQWIVNTVSRDGWFVNTTFAGNTRNAFCPFLAADIGWASTAACAETAVGVPDFLGP